MSGGLTHSPPIIPLPASDFASTTALIEYYGTVRGRLGWSAGQWMFFGTAGAAYGNVELSSTFSTLGLRTFSQTSEQKVGWVVGAGFEYLLRPNLMLSLGYQYVDLGRIGISSSTTGISGPSSVTLSQAATVHAQFQTVMAGMSWRFAPEGSSSPWAGIYAGGQGGGAWATTPPPPTLRRVNSFLRICGLSAISPCWLGAATDLGCIALSMCGPTLSTWRDGARGGIVVSRCGAAG